MKVDLARYSGFCMGVRRALELCMKAVKAKNTPLYTLGPLIHNNTVTSELESYGIKTLKDTKDVPDRSFVLIRTHGVSPKVREELISKRSRIIDATCPKVARVQGIIRKNVSDGFFILIIGDHDHAETKGLLGYAEPNGVIVSSEEELELFIKNKPKDISLCVVAQTTQDVSVFESMSNRLKANFKKVKKINTICDATKNRQEEVSKKAGSCDNTLVVGGKHSANTTRLFEIAKALSKNTFHIEHADELDRDCLKGKTAFVTAGASTPLWIVHEIAESINKDRPFNRVLSVLSSSSFMIFSLIFSLGFSLMRASSTSSYILSVLLVLSTVVLATSLRYIFFEKLDVFKLTYSYGRTCFLAAMVFLLMLSFIYTQAIYLLVLYYGILFYMVYRMLILRSVLLALSSLVFWTVPLFIG